MLLLRYVISIGYSKQNASYTRDNNNILINLFSNIFKFIFHLPIQTDELKDFKVEEVFRLKRSNERFIVLFRYQMNSKYWKVSLLIIVLMMLCNPFMSVLGRSQDSSSPFLEKAFRYNVQGWVYLHLEGDPYQRGFQYGYLLSDEISDTIKRWKNLGHDNNFKFMNFYFWLNDYNEISEKWWELCETKANKHFLKQIPEEYIKEMEGMVDGLKKAGTTIDDKEIEFDDILASQFVQDVWYGFFKFSSLKKFKILSHISSSFLSFIRSIPDDYNNHEGHCNAFIATGDATDDGGIIIGHSTIFHTSLGERCNIIVDIQPSDGNRFLMTCPPGSLWSQEDWYQNEQGIVLTETELVPQGPFKIKGNLPKGVRSRTAIQYADSIDEVIQILNEKNNGLIPNEWLIGDVKTGEIASLQQAFYNTPVEKKINGYFHSANIPHNPQVHKELNTFIQNILSKFIYKTGIVSQAADARDKQLKELLDKNYGKINVETAKKIMSTSPLSDIVTDCKITSTKMMERNGLWAFIGNPNGRDWIPSEDYLNQFRKATIAPACGWVEIFPSINNVKNSYNSLTVNRTIQNDVDKIWSFERNPMDINLSTSILSNFNESLYVGFSDGAVFSLNAKNGKSKWSLNLFSQIYDLTCTEEYCIIASDNGLKIISSENGNINDEMLIDEIVISISENLHENIIGVGCSDGSVYLINIKNKEIVWNQDLEYPVYCSNWNDNSLVFSSGRQIYFYNYDTNDIEWGFETVGFHTHSPLNNGKTIFFGSRDGCIYSIDSESDTLNWKFETGWGINSDPQVDLDTIFVGSMDNNFYALNKKTGDMKWCYPCFAAIQSNPMIHGDYVFFGCDDGRVYALNKTDGEYIWSFSPKYTINYDTVNNYITTPIVSDPIVIDDNLYIGVNGNVYALDTQTEEREKINDDIEGLNIVLVFSVLLIILALILFIIYRNRKGGGLI